MNTASASTAMSGRTTIGSPGTRSDRIMYQSPATAMIANIASRLGLAAAEMTLLTAR